MSAVTELPVELACPKCQDPSSLATVERIIGHSAIAVRLDVAGAMQLDSAHRTELDWDSATTVGVSCRGCFWTYEGEDWPRQLQPAGEHPDEHREPGTEPEVVDGALYADARGRVWRAANNGLSDLGRIEARVAAANVVGRYGPLHRLVAGPELRPAALGGAQ